MNIWSKSRNQILKYFLKRNSIILKQIFLSKTTLANCYFFPFFSFLSKICWKQIFLKKNRRLKTIPPSHFTKGRDVAGLMFLFFLFFLFCSFFKNWLVFFIVRYNERQWCQRIRLSPSPAPPTPIFGKTRCFTKYRST